MIKSKDLPAYGDATPCFGFPNGENDVNEVAAYFIVLLDHIGTHNKYSAGGEYELSPNEIICRYRNCKIQACF